MVFICMAALCTRVIFNSRPQVQTAAIGQGAVKVVI